MTLWCSVVLHSTTSTYHRLMQWLHRLPKNTLALTGCDCFFPQSVPKATINSTKCTTITFNLRPQSMFLFCTKIQCIYHLSLLFPFSSLHNQPLMECLTPSSLYNVFLFRNLLFKQACKHSISKYGQKPWPSLNWTCPEWLSVATWLIWLLSQQSWTKTVPHHAVATLECAPVNYFTLIKYFSCATGF